MITHEFGHASLQTNEDISKEPSVINFENQVMDQLDPSSVDRDRNDLMSWKCGE